MSELEDIEKAALQALAHACNYSLTADVPIQAVTCSFDGHLRGDAKKALKRLRRKGYCAKHPAGGTKTWQLTRDGLHIAKKNIGI